MIIRLKLSTKGIAKTNPDRGLAVLLNNPDRYLTIIARVPVKKVNLTISGWTTSGVGQSYEEGYPFEVCHKWMIRALDTSSRLVVS